jgi:hypothetical protein
MGYCVLMNFLTAWFLSVRVHTTNNAVMLVRIQAALIAQAYSICGACLLLEVVCPLVAFSLSFRMLWCWAIYRGFRNSVISQN